MVLQKTTIIFFALFMLNNPIIAQEELTLTNVPQKGLYFCWAASMETAMSFFSSSISQCSLAYQQARYFPSSVRPTRSCCNLLCSGACDSDGGRCNLCDQPLPYRTQLSGSTECEKIFKKFGFNATEKMNNGSLTPSDVKNAIIDQIDNDKPMLSVFTVNGAGMFGAHFAVIKGYVNTTTTTEESFMSVFDPWYPCEGSPSLLNFRILNGTSVSTNDRTYLNVLTYVQDISKIEPIIRGMAVRSPKSKILNPENNLSAETKKLLQYGITKTLKQSEFDSLKLKTPLQFVNRTNLDYLLNTEDACKSKSKIFEVYKTIDSASVTTTMQLIDNQWVPIEIKRNRYPLNFNVNIDNSPVTLNNLPSVRGVQCFEHIIISGTHYEFYKFVYNGKAYLIPIQRTSNMVDNNGKKLFQYKAYLASDLLNSIKVVSPTFINPKIDNSKK